MKICKGAILNKNWHTFLHVPHLIKSVVGDEGGATAFEVGATSVFTSHGGSSLACLVTGLIVVSSSSCVLELLDPNSSRSFRFLDKAKHLLHK